MGVLEILTLEPERHPWNTSFSWPGHTGPYRVVSPEQARSYDENGFFVLEDVIDASAIAKVTREIDPYEVKATRWLREKAEGSFGISDADAITFTVHLATRSPLLREFVSSDLFQGITHDLVGPDVRLYWDQAVYKKPEKPRPFPWHQDNGYTCVEPQAYLTCWIPLVDATETNGCPHVVPALHRLGTLKHWSTDIGFQCLEDDPAGAVPVPARAGSIVVFSSFTPHLTGPNTTGAVRKAYIVQFAPGGAVALRGEPGDPNPQREPQDNPDRQFYILKEGRTPDTP